MSTCKCGKQFEDSRGHGLCFACKIETLRFGSVPLGPSKSFLEREEVRQIKSKGHEPIRRSEVEDRRGDKPKKPDLGEKIKRQIHEQFNALA